MYHLPPTGRLDPSKQSPRAKRARDGNVGRRGNSADLHINQHRAQAVGRFQVYQVNLKSYRQVKHDTEVPLLGRPLRVFTNTTAGQNLQIGRGVGVFVGTPLLLGCMFRLSCRPAGPVPLNVWLARLCWPVGWLGFVARLVC